MDSKLEAAFVKVFAIGITDAPHLPHGWAAVGLLQHFSFSAVTAYSLLEFDCTLSWVLHYKEWTAQITLGFVGKQLGK